MDKHSSQTQQQRPRAAGLRKILMWFYVVCALSFVLDLVLVRYAAHPWDWVPFFYCVFGFVVCVILVVISKFMRIPFMRAENYYDDD